MQDGLREWAKQYGWARRGYAAWRAARTTWRRWRATLFRAPSVLAWPVQILRYAIDWRRYRRLPGTQVPRLRDSHPCLFERSSTTPVDSHYFYQGLWALRRILDRRPDKHTDVGSENRWVGWLTVFVPVTSIDIRPLPVEIENLECRRGSVLELPFEDRSIDSLSCLHVVEHVGLGRYGDPLDPRGTEKACRELARVVAPGGKLYLSLPVGRQRVCFNAHRVTDPSRVPELCPGLTLEEFSVIDDSGRFLENVRPEDYSLADYACGLYILSRV
ncbi:DUF268 domain-containing protein [Candidatus Sumerlaeota bacterium]|nr:DUF268 domain-containing protein [Candidatus Sumerlaeota bacterium]